MRHALLTILLFTLFLSQNPDNHVQAGSITVDGNCTLIDAIIAANTDLPAGNCQAGSGADTITLDVDVSLTTAFIDSSFLLRGMAGLPDITSIITIRAGLGTTISGNSTSFRIFNIATDGDLTLDGIIVSGGRLVGDDVSVGGGAFYVASGQTLTLLNSTVQNNTAEHTNGTTKGRGASGGGIYSQGTVILQNTVMTNNIAQGGAGTYGGFASGGAIYNLGTLSITSSRLISNQALGGVGTTSSRPAIGGAIANTGTISTIIDSTVQGNLAHGYGKNESTGDEASSGGAIHNANNLIEISGSTFSGNAVMVSTPGENAVGGAIYNTLTFGTITNSTFSGNSSQKTVGNSASGGAFYTNSGLPTFNHVTFVTNTALSEGDDLYLTGPTTVSVNNSILIGSNTGANCAVPSGVLTGSNNLTDDASCSSISTGAITLDTHIDSQLADNGGPTKTHALLNVPGNPAVDGNFGCGLTVDQRGEVRDVNCDIGAFELTAAVETPTVTQTPTFTTPSTNTGTPTIATQAPSDTLTFTPTYTNEPPTSTPSMTPSLVAQDIVVDGTCNLIDAINAANTDMIVGSCPAGNGADVIYLDIDTQLTQVYAPSTFVYGGRAGLPDITSDITIEARLGNVISGNSTNFRIFNISASGKLTSNGVTITNGRILTDAEEGRGGGLLNFGTLTLSQATITDNLVESAQTTSAISEVASGGGVFNDGTMIVDLSIFANNSATSGASDDSTKPARGGGIANNGILIVADTTFDSNRAMGGDAPAGGNGDGGGLYLYGNSQTTITRSTLSSNHGRGGSSTVFPDSGYGEGGAIYADEDSNLSITNSTLHGNQTTGGTHPTAKGYGGAIFSLSSNVVVNHVTLINNFAASAGDIVYTTQPVVNVSHSIIASPGGSADCQGIYTGTGNLTTDPSCSAISAGTILLGTHVEPTLQNNGGPTLTNALLPVPSNPAIDGNPTCQLSIDQRGILRSNGCDIGAYELQVTTPTDTPAMTVTADCNHPNLIVTILGGDGPFEISASAGINVPVTVQVGTTVINGPEKWDDLTVTELTGDFETKNLGQFKCRPLERPQPITPVHRSHILTRSPIFNWTAIPKASRYRVFLFDNKKAAARTVDMRQNTQSSETYLIFDEPLPLGRLFWRVRGRVNRVWGYWSIRYTLFVDPASVEMVPTPMPNSPAPASETPDGTGVTPPNSR